MSKVAHYLQEHLAGEILISPDARKYFSTDSSVFSLRPMMVVYPSGESDVRKVTRFTWQLAERGRVIPITARGMGSSMTGSAVSSGIVLSFPAHMSKIIELDAKSGSVVVEPGMSCSSLQQTLLTHGRFLPSYSSTDSLATAGGAIAGNAVGERSTKYGPIRNYVKGLRVVLANGEVIETRPLSKRELNKKMGLSSFEGEIYRSLDKLIEDNKEVFKNANFSTDSAAGYALTSVKQKKSFDLTPLIVGSQGTLGIITEATLSVRPYSPRRSLIVAFFADMKAAEAAVIELRKMQESPSALEVVDGQLLSFLDEHNPDQLKGIVSKSGHKLVMLVEFDNSNERTRKKLTKRALKIIDKYSAEYHLENNPDSQEELWKIRHSVAAVISHSEGAKRALPVVGSGMVPADKLAEHVEGIYNIFAKHGLRAALWGSAGFGSLQMRPLLDLSQVGDRQKAVKISSEYHDLVVSLGGTMADDGRLQAPFLAKFHSNEMYQLFCRVKEIFDPYGTLNPGVKVNVGLNDIKPLMRSKYSVGRAYDYLPRS